MRRRHTEPSHRLEVDDPYAPLIVRIRGATSSALLALLSIVVVALVASTQYPRLTFVVIGGLAVIAVTWPLKDVRNFQEIVSPWGFVIVSVVVGVGLHSAYIAFGLAEEDLLQRVSLLGHEPDYFLYPGLLLVLGLALLSVGYFTLPVARVEPARIVRRLVGHQFNRRALYVVVGACTFLAVVGFLRFAQETGGLNLAELSRKRATSPGLIAGDDFRGLGYLRFSSTLAGTAFLALVAYYATARTRITAARLGFLAASFLSACLLPFYASSRTGILWLLLLTVVIVIHAGRHVRFAHIAVTALIAVGLVHGMGVLRAGGDLGELASTSSVGEFAETIVVNRNNVDLAKTAHVVNAIPHVLDYKYGTTMTAWLVAPIPREIWPSKPVVQAGPEVGSLVYGHAASGVPPGLVAELFWNFHIIGVIGGCLLFGWGLRFLNEKFRPRDTRNAAMILIYSVAVVRLGMFALGTTVGQSLFLVAVDTLQALVIVKLASRRVAAPVVG